MTIRTAPRRLTEDEGKALAVLEGGWSLVGSTTYDTPIGRGVDAEALVVLKRRGLAAKQGMGATITDRGRGVLAEWRKA